jgi:hypothetical protein
MKTLRWLLILTKGWCCVSGGRCGGVLELPGGGGHTACHKIWARQQQTRPR